MRDRLGQSIRAGAVALSHGWNPLDFYSIADPVERMLVEATLNKAEEIAGERRTQFIKAIQVAVQNGVAKAFGAK